MKTTIELPDELLGQLRRVVRQEGSSLRRLVEEGLQRCLKARRTEAHRELDFPSYGGSGLTSEFQGAPWSQLRDEIYRERGAWCTTPGSQRFACITASECFGPPTETSRASRVSQ